MADPTPAPAEPAPPAKSGLPTILLIVNALLMVGVLGAVVMMLLKKPAASAARGDESSQGEKKDGSKEEGHGDKKEGGKDDGHGKGSSSAGVGPTLRLADFVVHLRNPESDRYARFSFEIEVGSEADKTALTLRQAQLRDAFIIYLSDRTAEDLRGSGGIEQVKAALLAKAVEMAKDVKVRQLYVTDFVMQ